MIHIFYVVYRVLINQPSPPPSRPMPTRNRPHGYPTWLTFGNAVASANAVYNADEGKLIQYKHLLNTDDWNIWIQALSNDFDRLSQGNGKVLGTDTIFFIHKGDIPKGRIPTYASIVVSIHPEKSETHRAHLTVGGNLIHYPVMSALTPLTSQRRNYFLTVYYPHPTQHSLALILKTFTLIHPCHVLNTSNSLSLLSQRTSKRGITSSTKSQKIMSMWKSVRGCMASPRTEN